jgi:uncharacterized protein (TIGR02246 family)
MTVQTTPRDAVLHRARAWQDAFDRKDAAAAAALYAVDAVLLPPNAEPLVGPAAIEAFVGGFFEVLERDTTATLQIDHLGEVVSELGSYTTVIRVTPVETVEDRGKYLRLWTHAPDGSWRIFREMFNSSLPAG